MLRVPDLNVGFESIVLMLGVCQLLALMQFVDVLMHFVLMQFAYSDSVKSEVSH